MKAGLRTKIVCLLFAVGFVLALWGVNYPYVGIYNTNNNYLSLAAKNYLRFGFVQLKFFPTYFAGKQFTSGAGYYLHHPILIFVLSAIPMILFKFQNWSVHATNFIFVIGEVFMMYVIARQVWDRRVALWAAGLAAVFPMTTFFWKYMFFEQASLFLNLIIYYFFIQYIRKPSRKALVMICMFAVFSGCIDWGVLYMLFPLSIFFFTRYAKVVVRPFVLYLTGAAISLGGFVVSVYVLQHGFTELAGAIWGRSYTAELTGLSYWPIRLVLISMLRMILYFTPVAIGALWIGLSVMRKPQLVPKLTIITFFVFGCLNLIFLPAASWGHSYFLYYFLPFFACAGGVFLQQLEKKSLWIYIWLVIIVLTSVGVNFLKIQQVKKQLWKYDVAAAINKTFTPYETVGVVNFAGDIFENYFFHPSQPIQPDQLTEWVNRALYQKVLHTVYVCAGTCTPNELSQIKSFDSAGLVTTYEAGGNEAWLITKGAKQITPVTEVVRPSTTVQVGEGNVLLNLYRFIRDTLSVGQI